MRRFYYGAADYIRNKYHLDQLPDQVTPLQDGTIEVIHEHRKLHGPAGKMFRLALYCPKVDEFWQKLESLRNARVN